MNKHIFVRSAFLCGASFFAQSIAVPVKPVGHETPIKTYYDRQGQFPGNYLEEIQKYLDNLIAVIEGIDQAIPVVGPIATMSSTASLKTVKNLHQRLEQLTLEEVGERADMIRVASLAKLAAPLICDMNNLLLSQLSDIDTLLSFWTYADEQDWHYFFHRNPLKWLKGSQVQEVRDKIKKLKKLKRLYNFHLGRLVIQVNTFDVRADTKAQYTWFQELYNILIAAVPNQKILDAKPNFEAVSALFGRAISSVEKFSNYSDKELRPFALPSNLGRHWMAITSSIAAVCVGAPVAMKHSDKIGASANSVGSSVKMFGNGVADALWGNDQKWETSLGSKEVAVAKSYERTLLRILPFYTKDNQKRTDIFDDLIKGKLQDDQFETKFSAEEEQNEAKSGFKNPDLHYIMAKIRGDKKFNVNELVRINELTNKEPDAVRTCLYCAMFGGNALPKPKNCLAKLDQDKLNKFTKKAISKAAYGEKEKGMIDLSYLSEVVLPLLGQTYSEEAESVGSAGKSAFHTLVYETNMSQAANVRLLANEFLYTFFVPKAKVDEKYDEITKGIVAAIKHFEGASDTLDTVANAPDQLVTAGRIADAKFDRWKFDTWKKAKLPVFLVASYLIYKAFKDEAALGWRLIKHWMPKTNYDDILKTLQELTLLLNIYGKKSLSEMEPHDVGLIHYLIDKLEQQEETIPKRDRESFMNDVRLLQAPDLSAKQKYNIVTDAIFNRYAFLREAHKAS